MKSRGNRFKTPENKERFVTMVLLGCDAKDIQEEIGMAESTYYSWFYDKEILAELDKRRNEIKDEGLAYIKARYKKYLQNIDKLCNDTTDRRTCLAANQFMIEKMDGKATAKVEVSDDKQEKKDVNVLNELEKLKSDTAFIQEDNPDDEKPLHIN